MAGNGTVTIRFKLDGQDGFKNLTMDVNGLRRAMQSAVSDVSAFEKKTLNLAAVISNFEKFTGAINQLRGNLSDITSGYESFNAAMREANTMAGKDAAGFKLLEEQVSDLSKRVPLLRDQLAKGLYQTISNGVPENNWMSFLETSARSAVGGLADINSVVGVTSTVIKNYGLDWEDAMAIQDKIQLTAKNGVTSFEQLAQALPRVTGNAATLGVTIDELMATFATLTGVSGNTAEVSTQLAAIFTALVKPSSEAAKMAANMGIQFDAAAIQAAGGFQQFLVELDKSVKAYSAASGVLEQEVYGKLFGNAESLRALVPLQGKLAETYTRNVATMADSTGTMDEAFKTMAASGSAVSQMLRNQFDILGDYVAKIVESSKIYVNFGASVLSFITNVVLVTKALGSANIASKSFTAGLRFMMSTMGKGSATTKAFATIIKLLGGQVKGTSVAVNGFKLAIRGLMIASGIGLVITGVTWVIEQFMNTADDAAESVQELDRATEAYAGAAAQAKVDIDKDTAALKSLMDAGKNTAGAIENLNRKYGDLFGTQKTASDWYKTLTENSEQYVKQLGYEAQIRQLTAQIAEQTINREIAMERRGQWERDNRDKMRYGRRDKVTGLSSYFSTDDAWKAMKANESAIEANITELEHRLDTATAKVDKLGKEIKKATTITPEAKTVDSDKSSGKDKKKVDVYRENAASVEQYEENVRALTNRLDRLGDTELDEAARLNNEIELWRKKADAVRNAGKEQKAVKAVAADIGYNAEAATLEGYRANIQALNEEKQRATRQRAEEINIEIGNWERLADAVDNAGVETRKTVKVYDEKADTLVSINANIEMLTELLQTATIEEAAMINRSIEVWNRKRDAIQNVGKATQSWSETMIGGWNNVKGVGSGIEGLTSALEGNKNAWQTLTGIIDACIQIYQSVTGIISMMGMLTGASAAQAAANKTEAATWAQLAAARTFASHASIPFVGTGLAAGMVATQQALIMSAGIPKFAEGGIAYGPTLGLFGEYAGAARNPEVVAPLDRLRDIMGDAGGNVRVTGELRARGSELVAVISNTTRLGASSGRRSNIKI